MISRLKRQGHFSKIRNKIDYVLSSDTDSRKFKRYLKNKKIKKIKSDKIILIEAWQPSVSQLALTILAPIYSELKQAELRAYVMIQSGLVGTIKQYVWHKFSVLSKINCTRIFVISSTMKSKRNTKNLAIAMLKAHETPELFEKMKVDGILIGDLIYDRYLKRYKKTTLDFNDKKLLQEILHFLIFLEKWQKVFTKNSIVGICISEHVYELGLPARIAISKDIEVLRVFPHSIYRLSNNYMHAETDWDQYRNIFKSLPMEEQVAGVEEAKTKVLKKFDSDLGFNELGLEQSPNLDLPNMEIIKKSEKIKVLVAAHDFYDAPHSYGFSFYPDFHIWLERLGELSELTNYDWYLKTHPLVRFKNHSALKFFVSKYPKFILLDAKTRHLDIINQGIDIVLTVNGTISSEYPAFGKIAINASLDNPHSSYSFSITPANVSEYESLILNLHLAKKNISEQEIYEFYFMHKLYPISSWIFLSPNRMRSELGSDRACIMTKSFSYFLTTNNLIPEYMIRSALVKFLNSKDVKLTREHFRI
jgi:hypothetical protein